MSETTPTEASADSPSARRRKARRTRNIIIGAIAVVVVAAVVVGTVLLTRGNGTAAAAPGEPVKIKVALVIEADWDPLGTVGGGAVLPAQSLVYDALVRSDAAGNLTPGLATAWNYSDDGLTFTVDLRDGVTFSDGTPFTAEAVKKHYDRAITGPRAWAFPGVESIEAVDDRTVVFHLSKPNYQLPATFSTAGKAGLIPSPAVDVATLETTPVGSGPFTLTNVVVDDHFTLTKNPNYWDAANIHIDEIELYNTADPASVVSAVKTGVYDLAWVQPAQLDEAESAGLRITETDVKTVVALQFNSLKAPFDNPKVVEALKYSIDRDRVVDTLTFGRGAPASQPVTEGNRAYQPELADAFSYDPERAKALLAEAGYTAANPLTFDYEVGQAEAKTAEFYQQEWAKIGVTARIKTVPDAEAFSRLIFKDEALVGGGFAPVQQTVQALNNVYKASGVINITGFVQPRVLELLETELPATPADSPEYAAKLKELYTLAVTEYPHVYEYEIGSFLIDNGRLDKLDVVSVESFGITPRWEGVKVTG